MYKSLREILKEKNISQSVVAEALNIQPNNIKRYDDLSKRSIEDIKTISKATGIDISELIGGNVGINPTNENPYLTTATGIKYFQRSGGKFLMRVPMVPVYAYAKYIDEVRDAEIWDGDGYFDFPVDQIYHGSYQAFEIKGDSMDDDSKRSLSHGDIVNARELGRDKWKSRLHTNQFPNWIIVTDNTILCKQIIKQNLDTGEITCHSLNPSPEYADFTINLDEVRKLFNIVQKVSSSF